jgi:hypothetical protein
MPNKVTKEEGCTPTEGLNRYHPYELRWGMRLERGAACTFVGGVENKIENKNEQSWLVRVANAT